MKNNGYPIYFKSKANDIYASYDGVRWFWYGNMECCQQEIAISKKKGNNYEMVCVFYQYVDNEQRLYLF